MNAVTNLPKYNLKGVIIKNLKLHNCFYYGMIDKVLYYYKENNYPVNWHISSDTASVNDYKCQKAFTKFGGRKYTAWFTRQLPISNGPYVFGGLPGLIVSISDATDSYKFELTRVYQPDESYHIVFPGNAIFYKQPGKFVSKLEYYRSYYDYQENFFGKAVASGMARFNDEDGLVKSYREKLKHRNNPIELDYKKP
ncbi:GLPGLI family protein [Hymenobacter psoromatis]|uniref:GLPGLI family protein n=1 Tax=Hymenobacter psoromatis TaxID=1484116 RepID=UPI001CBE04D0|nr:GLPGLI family protein [Hymenobacter psoromatis]